MPTSRPKLLITAGATREYLDDVRFLSNPATGRLGREIASLAAAKGWQVRLIRGPINAEIGAENDSHGTHAQIEGVEIVDVTSAQDMYEAVRADYKECDVFIAAAAVADFTPEKRQPGKIKKSERDGLELRLVRTKDILAWAGENKAKNQMNVGFALEADNDLALGREKLERKNCDLLIQNSPSNFGKGGGEVHILTPHETVFSGELDKPALAQKILGLIKDMRQPDIS